MSGTFYHRLVPVFALLLVLCVVRQTEAQTSPSPFSFRAGQSMYIVAFRHTQVPVAVDETEASVGLSFHDHLDFDLDAERKVRKRVEEWSFFRVADKPSADAKTLTIHRADDSPRGKMEADMIFVRE